MAISGRTNTGGFSGSSLRAMITVTSVVGFSLFGYDQGLMSGILTAPLFNDEFPPTAGDSNHASVVKGAVTSCYELGCFFGALFALWRGDRIGRKPLIMAGAFIIVVGTVVTVSAFGPHWGLGQFVIGRVITGVGNGLNTATIPVWQSEMSKAANRGRLVNLEGSIIAVGTLVAYWLDFGLSYVNSSVQWRFPIAFQIVFAVALGLCISIMPESSRWMITHDLVEDGMLVLSKLEGTTPGDEHVQLETRVILEASNRHESHMAYKELLTGGPTQHFKRMLLGASTQFFQQFTGCNAAIYYSTILFQQSLGMSRRLSLVLGGVFSTVYALSTIPSFFLIDRVGRRPLFLIGAVGQGCAFLISFACLVHPTVQSSKGAAFGLFLFIVFFAFTILPLPWIYPPEINPSRTRTAAASISTCTNWLCNFAVVMFTPPFITSSAWGTYLFFAVVNFLFVPLIYLCYPETAGRSLEEVDIIFAKAHNEKKMVWRVAQTMPKLTEEQIEAEAIVQGLYTPEEKKSTTDVEDEPEVDSNGSEQVKE